MQERTLHAGVGGGRVRTALLLAAGTGSRLSPLTDLTPKCLVHVNEFTILERLVRSLQGYDFKRLVVVVGHQEDSVREYLGTRAGGMEISYITSPLYKTTNNIYSLWLARQIIDEPFMLIESDLVFDSQMLEGMLTPDRVAVAKIRPWMNGTTVTVNRANKVDAFHCGINKTEATHFKTVNIYSLSRATWVAVCEKLDCYISNDLVDGYYETVFADMVSEGYLSLSPVFFDSSLWYEIDTLDDLRAAETVCELFDPQLPTNNFISISSLAIQSAGLMSTVPSTSSLKVVH
ncbi:sugar phosphate nucleotidyltransferase [Desulfogranum marinum]|uniref:phosphocholine cytidylyltransferase family protein n=1 Tax=Desulfogranum marinum TaxID=453220 RepID=UPI001963FDA9|nr:phosphocholine cytidylyltransferase family protein [Desulfogranum marinum]MBM9512221.1 phosphocholine cytidylyltransferase family protein [Desulfogranum marinum]